MERDHMVQAFPPKETNHPLDVGALPGGARRGQNFVDAHVLHLVSEFRAEDGIAIAQQITRELVEGKGLPQLLSGPLRGRVRGHIAGEQCDAGPGPEPEHI